LAFFGEPVIATTRERKSNEEVFEIYCLKIESLIILDQNINQLNLQKIKT